MKKDLRECRWRRVRTGLEERGVGDKLHVDITGRDTKLISTAGAKESLGAESSSESDHIIFPKCLMIAIHLPEL